MILYPISNILLETCALPQAQLESDLEEQTMGLTQLLQTTQQRCQALEDAAAAAKHDQEGSAAAGDKEGSAERSDQVQDLAQKLAAAEADAATLRTQVVDAADKKLHVAYLECLD